MPPTPPLLHVRLYGRPGCCLCDEAAHLLEGLRGDYDFAVEKIDIDDDPALKTRLCCQIPVITVNGGSRVALRVTEARLRRAFERARHRTGSSTEGETPAPNV